MEFDANQRRQVLQDFMKSADLNVAKWEVISELGDGTLRKFMEGKTETLTDRTYAKLAAGASRHLGRPVSIAELQGVPPQEMPIPNAVLTPTAPPLPHRTDMDKDVPVYGTVVGGSLDNHADFELNGQIVDFVRRPPRFKDRKDIFAAYTQGESMLYWREPGQLIYFEKIKPPRVMDYVLIELKPHNGDDVRPALVKRLLGITPTKVRLRQFNPPEDFEIDRDKVLQIVRVIDWDELMGV